MSDLGNLNGRLALKCKLCPWRPADATVMEAVLLHMNVEHDTDQVALDMVAVCSCGSTMEFGETRPTGGGFKDYVVCEECGNTGYIKRDGERTP